MRRVKTHLINTIALRRCDDERHVIRFQQDGALRSCTLAELDRKAARVAVRLQALGVRPRDRVGILSRNRIEFVLLDLAILKLGGVSAGFEAGRYEPGQIVDIYGLKALFGEGLSGRPMLRHRRHRRLGGQRRGGRGLASVARRL